MPSDGSNSAGIINLRCSFSTSTYSRAPPEMANRAASSPIARECPEVDARMTRKTNTAVGSIAALCAPRTTHLSVKSDIPLTSALIVYAQIIETLDSWGGAHLRA